jgi:hypothetical protein
MNPKNEWLDTQQRIFRLEQKTKRTGDTKMLLKFMILLLPLLLYAISLHGDIKKRDTQIAHKHRYMQQMDGGVYFTCKRCRTAQWQKKDQADWRGYYYCTNCRCRMGDE